MLRKPKPKAEPIVVEPSDGERVADSLERGLESIAHQISGLHTGNPGDNPFMLVFDNIARSNNRIADAILELVEAVRNRPHK
jgi:threonine dehydratase